jgi:hypothetical protein
MIDSTQAHSMPEPLPDPTAESSVEPRLLDPPASELIPTSEAEANHAPEPPMLEVHAPHEVVHTWKDFFIHIATIVIGLLIAVGLEQAVEYLHHRELAAHTRDALAQEMNNNRKIIPRDVYALKMHQKYLFSDLPVIQRARTHSLVPSDRIVVWHPYSTFADSAWQTAHESNAAALLPYAELRRLARVYRTQDLFNSLLSESAVALQRADTVFYRSAADRFDMDKARSEHPTTDGFGEKGEAAAHAIFEQQAPGPDRIQQLTPAQLDRLELAIQQGIYEDDRLINFCTALQGEYDLASAGNQQ